MMDFKKEVTNEFGFTSDTFGPIKVTVTLTGDDMFNRTAIRSLEEIEQRADAWMRDEVLPCLDWCLTQMAIVHKPSTPLERTAFVGSGGYTIVCQLLLEEVFDVPLTESDDIKLTALPWALLGKNNRHARTQVLLKRARLEQPA